MLTRRSRKQVVTEDDMREFHSRHLQTVIRKRGRGTITVEYLIDRYYKLLSTTGRSDVTKLLAKCRPALFEKLKQSLENSDLLAYDASKTSGLSVRIVVPAMA